MEAPKQRKRKGARLGLAERRKNYERKFAEPTSIHIPAASLPDLWEVHADEANETTRYFKVVHSEVSRVVSSVVIFGDHTWDAIIHERKLDHSATLLARFPQCMSATTEVVDLISILDKSTTCLGNPEEGFVEVCKKRGGSIEGSRGFRQVVGILDITDASAVTVRSTSCEYLVSHTRCGPCINLRRSLRSAVSRQQSSSHDRTAADSHTSYSRLTSEEKDERLRNLHQRLKVGHN